MSKPSVPCQRDERERAKPTHRRPIKHNDTTGPVGAVGRVVGALAQEVKVGLAELDVDAAAVGAGDGLDLPDLLVEQGADALEYGVGLRHGESKLERVAAQAVLPLWGLVRVQAADKHVVVPAVHGPLGQGLLGSLFAEVGLLPLAEEDFLAAGFFETCMLVFRWFSHPRSTALLTSCCW